VWFKKIILHTKELSSIWIGFFPQNADILQFIS